MQRVQTRRTETSVVLKYDDLDVFADNLKESNRNKCCIEIQVFYVVSECPDGSNRNKCCIEIYYLIYY